MKKLNLYITEKFKINSKNVSKPELRKYVANCSYENVEMKLSLNSAQEEKDYIKVLKQHKAKNDFNSLKNTKVYRDLLMYWYFSITIGWLTGALEFKEEIIKRRYFDADEMDAYVLSRYKRLKGFKETEKNMEEYLDENYVEYKKNEED